MSVHKNLGYHPGNFFVIPNGVDTGRFTPDAELRREVRKELNIPDDAFAVTMVARRDPQKDHETFIKAIDLIPGAIGVLSGKGTEEFADQANLRRLGVREDIERIYAGCDIVGLCSAFGEGFPNVLVEGMSAGLAPIATDVGDCALIVGDVGEIVPPRNVEAFAGAIRSFIDKGREKVQEAGAEARERIKQEYALERAVATFDDVYRGAVEIDQPSRSQTMLAVFSAVVSRLAAFGALIAAARMLEPVEFGVFAVLTALVGVVNAVVSGGGDMWLNSFTGSSARKLGHAPRISPAYLTTCLALAATMAAVISGVFFASNVSSFSEWVEGHAPQVAMFLTEFPLATLLAVLGACFAGLFEAQLAVLRAGNRVTEFFCFSRFNDTRRRIGSYRSPEPDKRDRNDAVVLCRLGRCFSNRVPFYSKGFGRFTRTNNAQRQTLAEYDSVTRVALFMVTSVRDYRFTSTYLFWPIS